MALVSPIPAAPEPALAAPPTSTESAVAEPPLEVTPSAFPAFEVEPLYLPGKRPRPTGRMAASQLDEELARWNLGGSSQGAYPSNRAGYHPAPRVVVELKALSRALPERAPKGSYASAATLLAEARNQGYWPFRLCFEQGLRENPELSGQIQMRVRIATSGRVVSARLRGVPLRSHRTVECALRAASALTFKKRPARRVEVELGVKFWPGDAPLPPRDERATPPWDARPATQTLAANASELARCCVEALGRDPKLWGRLAFTVRADSTGRILEGRETESRFPDRDASECMRQAFTRLPPLPTAVSEFVLALRCGQPAGQPASPEPASDDAVPGPAEADRVAPTHPLQ